ncbi:MAG: cytochrome c biogenesis protein CcsA [Coriobacteriia bacterium]|nr:cytochrome c biogenesis protein CcsA [Coriobacteriia bacterium]
MTSLGSLFLGIAALSAIVSVVSLFWARSMPEKEGEGITNVGYLATYGVLVGTTGAIGVLMSAFFREDFAFEYVAFNHSTDVSSLSWLYKFSGIWAGREGSLLFWAWLLAIFGAYVAYRRISETDDLSNASIGVFNIVQLFFLAALFIPLNDPFKAMDPAALGPQGELLISAGMNPLLQHWAMILHPPTLFIGYAGLAVPFAFAMGALIVGDGSKAWIKIVDRITVVSWLFLGIGIGLGAIWAYVVLGWGGYWAWDPVENASLLPWLTGVGLIHSFTVYRRREAFKKWAVMMSAITFALVVLGTWITRSGIVQSVHAFEEDPLSAWLFGAMIVLPIVLAAIGLVVRSEQFSGADEFESLTSKESSYYFNNVFMLIAAIVVTLFTIAPTFGGKEFGAQDYDAVAHPLGILYVLIMALCPLLSWRKTDAAAFWRRVRLPLTIMAILLVVFLAIWYTQMWPILDQYTTSLREPLPATVYMDVGGNVVDLKPGNPWEPGWLRVFYSLLGMAVGAFAIAVSISLFAQGSQQRAKAKGEGVGTAFLKILGKARTQSGGYLTHLGIGIIIVGLVGSAMFVEDLQLPIPAQPGAQFAAGGYTFTYEDFEEEQLDNGDVVNTFRFAAAKGGSSRGYVEPGQVSFFRQGQTKLNADVISEPLKDVFIVVQEFGPDGIVLNVKVNPLISWVWVGFLLTIIGAGLAAWPKRAPVAAPVATKKKRS